MSDKFSDDDGFYDTEDEEWDAPITASWGVPAAAAAAPEAQDQTSETADVNGWHQIADPNAKIRADGVGAGNLHRKGKNFQPVDEQHILNQRLGKAIPKSKTKQIAVAKKATKVSIQPIAGNKPPHVLSVPGTGKKAAKKARSSALSAAAERARAVERAAAAKQPAKHMANPDPHVNSVWKAGTSLADTPFWEQASSRQSIHAPPTTKAPTRTPAPAPVHPPVHAPARDPAPASALQPTKERRLQSPTQPAPHKEPTKFTFIPPSESQQLPQPTKFTFFPPPPEFQQPTKPKVEFQIKGAAESIRKVKAANAAVTSDVPNKSKPKREITIGLPKPKQEPKLPISTAKPVAPPPTAPAPARARASVPPAAPALAPSKPVKPAQPAQSAKVTKPNPPEPAPQPTKSAPPVNKTGAGSSDSRWASTPSNASPSCQKQAANNPVIVTLNIELEKGEALPIIVRAKDDPKELATAFVERLSQRKNNISIDNNIVQALTQLIEQKIRDKRI
ncbi:hypothetical protein INT43_008618 [Umbelopsis isabellina]|uniref:Uncharacterized protein n=1 Tax=Mortierella isabellina TaxID=91625 RepID=A0A8H7PXN8_MORIS|nr:hypothetical protein INT43_008618 [Umbelopsis isabellina]